MSDSYEIAKAFIDQAREDLEGGLSDIEALRQRVQPFAERLHEAGGDPDAFFKGTRESEHEIYEGKAHLRDVDRRIRVARQRGGAVPAELFRPPETRKPWWNRSPESMA